MKAASVLFALACAAVGGCYEVPTYPVGLACSTPHNDCPPNQICENGYCRLDMGTQIDAPNIRVDSPPMQTDAPPIPCTLYPQANCPLNYKCTFDSSDQTQATRVCVQPGNVGVDGQCTGTPGSLDNCIAGAVCLFGTCRAFCGAPASGTCIGPTSCVGIANITACLTMCNPLGTACASANGVPQNCYLNQGDGTSVCVPPDMSPAVAEGGSCNYLADCVGGTTCFNNVCRKYCDYASFPNVMGSCTSGLVCRQIYGNVGGCAP